MDSVRPDPTAYCWAEADTPGYRPGRFIIRRGGGAAKQQALPASTHLLRKDYKTQSLEWLLSNLAMY